MVSVDFHWDDVDNDDAYRHWRKMKFAGYPARIEDLVVRVENPFALAPLEKATLLRLLQKCNMAIYRAPVASADDPAVPVAIMAQLGATRFDRHPEADDDGVSRITPKERDDFSGELDYIPYTTRPISWHTDGYYNTPDRKIRSLVLHCVQPASHGGENEFIDQEIVYAHLREADKEHIRALMEKDALTIPPRIEEGVVRRPAVTGPVFAIASDRSLTARYTHRTKSVAWKKAENVSRAVAGLREILEGDSTGRFCGRLDRGEGFICNNVFHTRRPFDEAEDASDRLLYRIRYYDRIVPEGMEAKRHEGHPANPPASKENAPRPLEG